MPEAIRQLAAIMPARRNPQKDEGGFTEIVEYIPIVEADKYHYA